MRHPRLLIPKSLLFLALILASWSCSLEREGGVISTGNAGRIQGKTTTPIPGEPSQIRLIKIGARDSLVKLAVTDASGAFEFSDLPAGDYRLEAWNNSKISGNSDVVRVAQELVSGIKIEIQTSRDYLFDASAYGTVDSIYLDYRQNSASKIGGFWSLQILLGDSATVFLHKIDGNGAKLWISLKIFATNNSLESVSNPTTLPIALLHLRADTGVVLDANLCVALWKDLSPRRTDFGTTSLGAPQAIFTTNNYDTIDKRVYKTYPSDSSLRPRLIREGIAGLPSIGFDGEQLLTNASSLPLDAGYTLFAVVQDSNPVGQPSAVFTKGPNDFNNTLSNGWNNNLCGNWSVSVAWNQCLEFSNVRTFQPALYENTFDGKTGSSYINGTFQSSGPLTTTFQRNKDAWIGGTINPNGMVQSFLKGRISEIIVYPGALDSTARKQIEASLMTRYQIQPGTISGN